MFLESATLKRELGPIAFGAIIFALNRLSIILIALIVLGDSSVVSKVPPEQVEKIIHETTKYLERLEEMKEVLSRFIRAVRGGGF